MNDQDRVRYWREHEGQYPHQCVRPIGDPRPEDVQKVHLDVPILVVPLNNCAFWGFRDRGFFEAFIKDYPLDPNSMAAMFDPSSLNAWSAREDLFARLSGLGRTRNGGLKSV